MLILLVGPKGSGKSHIGRLLETSFGVHFAHVEPLWMAYHEECAAAGRDPSIAEGIERVRPSIARALAEHGAICVETTGASREILDDLLAVGSHRGIRLVRVTAPLDVCLDRIASRDPAHQIPADSALIARVHRLSSELDLPWDLVIENDGLSEEELVERLRSAVT